MDDKIYKAKKYNIIALVSLIILLTVVIGSVIFMTSGPANGDFILFFFPIYILLGAISLSFRSKAKESLMSPTKRATADNRQKRFILIITIALPIVVLIVGLIIIAISKFVQP